MKNEIYEYACPKRRMTAKQAELNKKDKSDGLLGYLFLLPLLVIFSLPMALEETLLWCMILGVYLVVFILNKITDKDPYSNMLMSFGATIAYFGVVISWVIVSETYKRFDYSCLSSVIIMSVIGVAFYEGSVLFNILTKKYTARNQNNKIYPAVNTTVGTSVGFTLGSLIVRKIAPQIAESFLSVCIGVIICSLTYTVAFAFLQKYLLYKLFKKLYK